MSDEAQPKKTLEQFLASVPDAPSAAPEFAGEEPASDEETPKPEKVGSKPAATESAPTAAPSASATNSAGTTSVPDLEAIRKALREGDLETIGELLDEDPAGFDEKTPRWAARNRREAKLKAENAAVLEKAERIVSKYSAVDTLLTRLANDDYSALPELVEHAGKDWDSAAMKAFRARRGQDPRVPALEARVAKAEAEVAEVSTERQKVVDRLFFETLRDEVDTKHVVRKVDGWEEKVALVLRESVDDTGDPRLSVKQAADRVVRREREEFEKRASIFEPERKTRTRAATPERAAGATGTTKRRLTRDEWLAARAAAGN